MVATLHLNQHTDMYEGYSPTQRLHLSVTAAAMAAARRLGVRRAETNIHFFARIMDVDFWLQDPALLALPGVSVQATPAS